MRPEALLIKTGEDLSYAQALGEIRKNVNPQELKTEIKSVRRTRMGDVLLELGSDTSNKAKFCEALRNALGTTATVRNLEPRTTLEIRDLDSYSTEAEVEEAVKKNLKEFTGALKVFLSKPNTREQRLAFVEIGTQEASELLKIGRVKVGWVYCRVLRRTIVTRCYACFGYGHHQAVCKGPDRKKQGLCLQCGEKGHLKKECKAEPKCFLCAEHKIPPERIKHVSGSGACPIFRQALDEAKKKPIKLW
jgi:hypothetical protein